MKKLFKAVPVLCTLLLLGLGAWMPGLAAVAFDWQLATDRKILENQNISLTLTQEADFFQTLELFRGGHSLVELTEGFRMTGQEVETVAQEVRQALMVFAADEAFGTPLVRPMLLTSNEVPGLSGVFWLCIWGSEESPESPGVLWLDDQSGLMVYYSGPVGWSSLSSTGIVFEEGAMQASEYCRQRYPVKNVELALESDSAINGTYSLTLLRERDGQEESLKIPLRLREGWLDFNV